MRQELVEKLTKALDERTRKRLVGYALKLVRHPLLNWRGETDLVQLAEDITSEAICKTITGERKWNPEKTPDPVAFLASAIKSLVNSHNRKERNSEYVRELDAPEGAEIHDMRLSAQTQAESEEFLSGLKAECRDDELCTKVLELFADGYKPGEVAKALNHSDKEIYAAKKRLARKTTAFLQKSKVGS